MPVNNRIAHLHGYGGKVGHITVHLWRGAYRIHDINIYKTSGNIREPFFEATYVDLSIEWFRLVRGKVVGQVYMMNPKINFEDGSWLLMRASGTEPIVRVYAESTSQDAVRQLIAAGVGLVEGA